MSHPELDILEGEVKRALRSTAVNKASECDETPAELSRSLEEDRTSLMAHMVKCLPTMQATTWRRKWQPTPLFHFPWKIPWMEEPRRLHTSPWGRKVLDTTEWLHFNGGWHQRFALCQQIWKTQQWPPVWKRSILTPIPKKCANHQTIALISHTSKIMLKFLHARLQHYANQELPDVQAAFRKGRRTRNQIANIHWIIEKAREFQKKSISVSLTVLKSLAVWIMQTVESS